VAVSRVARDITRQKQAERELRAAQKQLEEQAHALETNVRERTARLQESVAELEAFSYSLSHDMRAPLRAIQSFTEIVLEEFGAKIGPEGTSHLNRVISAAVRMDRLIQDVLAFSRVSRQEIALEPVDVEKLVRDILHERPTLQPPKAEITIESPLQRVTGHTASLTQCLTNLLDNAVKFVPRGVTPRVRIRTESVPQAVRIWIEDNGIGIAPEARSRLFGMFQRLHTRNEYEGTGVGLAIVRRAAERMNGRVGVESEPGRGSRFWIELPEATS
jgi:signal transduction histidine kinase